MRQFSFSLLTMALVGCSGGSPDGTSDETDDTDEVSTDDTGETGTPEPTETVSGTLTDGAGNPLGSVQVQVCRGDSVCQFAQTDANGAYAIEFVGLGDRSLEAIVDTPLAIPMTVITVAEGGANSHDLVAPTLDTAVPIPTSATELELGSGLFVTLSADGIEPPNPFGDPATETAGVSVPQGQWTTFPENTAAVWYLSPFDYHSVSEDGLPTRIEGLADGTYAIQVASYEDTAWLPAGTLTVSGGTPSGDLAIPVLSTVIAVAQ